MFNRTFNEDEIIPTFENCFLREVNDWGLVDVIDYLKSKLNFHEFFNEAVKKKILDFLDGNSKYEIYKSPKKYIEGECTPYARVVNSYLIDRIKIVK